MSLGAALWLWADTNGLQADIQINTLLLRGQRNETTSLHAAEARDAGRRWGCVLCRWLNAIEPDHCTKVLAGAPTPRFAAVRAGVAILVLWLGILSLLFNLWSLL